jgi:hypothetical protein
VGPRVRMSAFRLGDCDTATLLISLITVNACYWLHSTHNIIFALLPLLDPMHQLNFGSAKARVSSKSQTGSKETFYLAKSTTFAGAQTALSVFKEIAGKTGVPGLQDGVKALVIVLDAMQV